ncbi:MAG: nicotinate (nicotinamide) nucleotide adenylyltransferase [Chlorobiaceae bacterium]|nr:nicotinate (nicotinamide) nucleotide adenylyltransferase [Chlorobiaceae bacterium]
MRIGVFGGSFDPPHNGHLALCILACERLCLDRLLVSVSRNPFKSASDAPDIHREQMAGMLVAELDRSCRNATLDTRELEHPGPSFTVELLRRLRDEFPADELFLIVGEDSYRDMPKWMESGAIPGLCTIVVFGRPVAEVPAGIMHEAERLPAIFVEFDMPVSATGVRALLAKKEPVAHLVPRAIAAYIEANGLYR